MLVRLDDFRSEASKKIKFRKPVLWSQVYMRHRLDLRWLLGVQKLTSELAITTQCACVRVSKKILVLFRIYLTHFIWKSIHLSVFKTWSKTFDGPKSSTLKENWSTSRKSRLKLLSMTRKPELPILSDMASFCWSENIWAFESKLKLVGW